MTWRRNKLVIVTAVCLAILVGGIAMVISFVEDPGTRAMLDRMADLYNQEVIAKAVISYMEKNHGSMLDSLGVLVDNKLLPSSSPIYCSPYHCQETKAVSYTESSYYIVPNKKAGDPGFYILRYHRNEGESVEDGYVEINALIDDARLKVENSHQPSLHQ
jgi:hypothetical protein